MIVCHASPFRWDERVQAYLLRCCPTPIAVPSRLNHVFRLRTEPTKSYPKKVAVPQIACGHRLDFDDADNCDHFGYATAKRYKATHSKDPPRNTRQPTITESGSLKLWRR